MISLVAVAADVNGRRGAPGPKHRRAVAERGRAFSSVSDLVERAVPALQIRAVRRHLAAGDGHIAVVGERQECRLSRQRDWRRPIRREAHESRTRQIERKDGIAFGAVEVQAEEDRPQLARPDLGAGYVTAQLGYVVVAWLAVACAANRLWAIRDGANHRRPG